MTTSTGGRPSEWGVGGSYFAGAIMATVGILQFFEGLVALIDGKKFYVTTANYSFEFTNTAWGWIHLILGAVIAISGFLIFTGNVLARAVGIALAALSTLANFLWLPYYPFWALVVIGINILVIWSLANTRLGADI